MTMSEYGKLRPDVPLSDVEVSSILYEATRALLWVASVADARRVAVSVVTALGGSVESANAVGPDSIAIDLSFGDGEPFLPTAAPGSSTRALLERHLPSFVVDARRAVEIGSHTTRLADEASIDSLTRLPNRRMLGRALGRLRAGDVVIMLDLDHFKKVNDTIGHDAGDAVLRALGATLLGTIRERDSVGRYGGEEFVVILHDGTDADAFLDRLRTSWERDRPHPLTFSAGVAQVRGDALHALRAADRAMYRAKAAGRNRSIWAAEADYSDEAVVEASKPADLRQAFVAFSQLAVPSEGHDALEAAFVHRLRAVDGWPGFQSLEVWADIGDPTAFAMVSWWDSPESFRNYMQSDEHRRSHDRITTGEHRPTARGFHRFQVVAR